MESLSLIPLEVKSDCVDSPEMKWPNGIEYHGDFNPIDLRFLNIGTLTYPDGFILKHNWGTQGTNSIRKGNPMEYPMDRSPSYPVVSLEANVYYCCD